MNKIMMAAVVAAAMVPMAASAQGVTYNNFNPVVQSGTFGNNGGIGDATFTNTFTFVVTSGGMLASNFTNVSTGDPTVFNGGPADIDFTGATLSGGTLTAGVNFTRLLGEPTSRTELWDLASPLMIGAGTYTLTIAGRSYGSLATYSGNFNITPTAAIPEAATWAMMIVGIGAVGGTMRRRRVATKVSFA